MTELVEKLERELEAATDDRTRVRALNELAHHIRGADPQRSVRLSEEAYALADSIGDEAGVASGLLGLGFGHLLRGEYQRCLDRGLEAQTRFRALGDELGGARAGIFLGFAYRSLGVLDKALEHYLSAQHVLRAAESDGGTTREDGLGWCLYGIAGIQQDLHDHDHALQHYEECLEIFEASDQKSGRARALNGIGSVQVARGQHEAALETFRRSLEISEGANVGAVLSRTLTDMADCLEALGKSEDALAANRRALDIREEVGFRDAALTNRINLGRLLLQRGDVKEARAILDQARALADEFGVRPKLARTHELLAQLHEREGAHDRALEHFQRFHRLESEVHGEEVTTRVRNLQIANEVELAEKEAEIQRLRNVELARLNQELQESNDQILREQEHNERLLHNILPAKIVRDLRHSGTTHPETFDDVTVFFSDFVGFTAKSATLDPALLIHELNEIFTRFDELAENHDCERIKTIGDAYLAVCGMPKPDPEHALKILRLARDAVGYVQERNGTSEMDWPIRIGVHSGRVVGGVVGVKKYIYDVFGDTINTASRMESNSEAMRINVSESTYELTQGEFSFTPRREIEVKGKGAVRMYFLDT